MSKTLKTLYLIIPLIILASTSITLAQTLNVTVNLNKNTFTLREIVQISGNVTFNGQPTDGGLVGIQVEDPLGATTTIRTIPSGTDLNEFWPLEITEFTPCDDTGNPKQAFYREDWAWFKVTVKNPGVTDRTVLITITVYDNDTIPLGVKSTQLTILAGATTTFIPAIWVPNWAKNGSGTAYANVYSTWPKLGGRPYCPEETTTFAIRESEYTQEKPSQPPSPTIQNGTYTTQFRLSPEPIPGEYSVSISAWYKGYTAQTSTTFSVIDTTAPPRANFVIKPPIASPGYEITFDASPSSAEGYNDTITSYTWDFGDNQTATGKKVTHTYSAEGNYTVTLNVTDTEGYWNTTSRTAIIVIIHDVSVLQIESLTDIYNDWIVKVKVTVKNKGTVSETFNVTLSVNSTQIDVKEATLEPYATTTLTYTWNTSGLIPLQNYTLTASADILPDEPNITDNTLESQPIFVRLLGDTRFDRKLDILDVVKITGKYGITSSDPEWDIMLDLKPDGKLDILDVLKITGRYGTTY